MDSSSGNNVSGVSHWDRPSEMVVSSVCAKLLASQPLGRGANKSLIPNVSDKEASEQHSSSDKTESLDDHVAIEVFLVFGKRSVDDVAEIWLETDVKETQNGQDLIDYSVTDGRVEIGSNEKILYRLEQLHCEEKEHS